MIKQITNFLLFTCTLLMVNISSPRRNINNHRKENMVGKAILSSAADDRALSAEALAEQAELDAWQAEIEARRAELIGRIALLECYAGLRLHEEVFSFRPSSPYEWSAAHWAFSFSCQSCRLARYFSGQF